MQMLVFQAFVPEVSPGLRPSLAVAAFRLGYLGRAIWSDAETLWFLLAIRNKGIFWHEGAKLGIPNDIERLYQALEVLSPRISNAPLDRLISVAGWFNDFNEQLIGQAEAGLVDFAKYIGRESPWEAKSSELRSLCDMVFADGHLLRPLYDLGVAFGEFVLQKSRYYSHEFNRIAKESTYLKKPISVSDPVAPREIEVVDHRRHEVGDECRFPDICDLARRAARIRSPILERSRLLSWLARSESKLVHVDRCEALRSYYEENRECFEPSAKAERTGSPQRRSFLFLGPDGETPWKISDDDEPLGFEKDSMAISRLAINQVAWIEEDLATVPDADFAEGVENNPDAKDIRDPKIDWDEIKGILTIGGIFCFKVARQARNLRPILNAFQAKNWSVDKVMNPLLAPAKDNFDALSQAIHGLNEETGGRLEFSEALNMVRWRWPENFQNSQENDP